jgi:hypothetical protein
VKSRIPEESSQSEPKNLSTKDRFRPSGHLLTGHGRVRKMRQPQCRDPPNDRSDHLPLDVVEKLGGMGIVYGLRM